MNRVLICDDHLVFCQGLKGLIQKKIPNSEVDICSTLAAAEANIKAQSYSALIFDIRLGSEDGIEFIRRKKRQIINGRIIVLSAYYSTYIIQRARKAGADYFLKKEMDSSEILDAIEGKYEQNFVRQTEKNINVDAAIILSRQEREIVYLISLGLTSKAIAEKLAISKTTVDTHRKNIHRKLGSNNSAEILKMLHEGKI